MTRSDEANTAHQRALLETYHQTRDLRIRDQLVTENLRLALHLARQFANRGVSIDDLEQIASLGLIGAIDRFDPARDAEFSTFATPTIVGELKRHFRDKGWSVRVPRRIQDLHLLVNTLVTDLTHQYGRPPTIAELAFAARASQEEVLEAMEAAQAYRSVPVDGSSRNHPVPDEFQLGVEDLRLFQAEDRLQVDALLAYLGPREQLLLRLRFYDEMTQQQIAERLGVSQMHVSRLLARSLKDLRDRAAQASS